jgi:hypothetical protein
MRMMIGLEDILERNAKLCWNSYLDKEEQMEVGAIIEEEALISIFSGITISYAVAKGRAHPMLNKYN